MHKYYSDEQIFLTVCGLKREIGASDCNNISGFRARILNTLLTIYVRLALDAVQGKASIKEMGINNSTYVLKNKKIKFKLRMALILYKIDIELAKTISIY